MDTSRAVVRAPNNTDAHAARWQLILSLVLDGISSPHTYRSYSQALEEFLIWFESQPERAFNKAAVQRYRTFLEAKGLAPSSVNVRLAAIRRFAAEAADNGLLEPELATGIAKVKGGKRTGVRMGRWLTADEAARLLTIPDASSMKGIRDRAMLAMLIGAGLRRSEIAALDCKHVQLRDGRWAVVDLVGKHGRIRTIPIPGWSKVALDRWLETADVACGPVFRQITRCNRASRNGLSPQAVFAVVHQCARAAGLEISPHDLRRTFARLAHTGNAPLEQIQLSLGHASVLTTELYLGLRQNLVDAPCDHLGIEVHLHD